ALRRRCDRRAVRRMAVPGDARAARVPAAGCGRGERGEERTLQPAHAHAHPARGSELPRVHAVDGSVRRRQPDAHRATGAAVLRAHAHPQRHADRPARGGAAGDAATVPAWARLFDGSHVVRYRARQGWALVLASGVLALGVFAGSLPVLWTGAVLLGAAQ